MWARICAGVREPVPGVIVAKVGGALRTALAAR